MVRYRLSYAPRRPPARHRGCHRCRRPAALTGRKGLTQFPCKANTPHGVRRFYPTSVHSVPPRGPPPNSLTTAWPTVGWSGVFPLAVARIQSATTIKQKSYGRGAPRLCGQVEGPWIGPRSVHFRPFFQQEHENISAALILRPEAAACGPRHRVPRGSPAACQVGGDALARCFLDGQFMNGSRFGVMVEKASTPVGTPAQHAASNRMFA